MGDWQDVLRTDDKEKLSKMIADGWHPLPPSGACVFSALSYKSASVAGTLSEMEGEMRGLGEIMEGKRGVSRESRMAILRLGAERLWALDVLVRAAPEAVASEVGILRAWARAGVLECDGSVLAGRRQGDAKKALTMVLSRLGEGVLAFSLKRDGATPEEMDFANGCVSSWARESLSLSLPQSSCPSSAESP